MQAKLLRSAILVAAMLLGPAIASADMPLRREPADGDLRLGQRVKVDDGTCPAGQVKQVTGATLTPQGVVVRTAVCVKR